MVSKPSMAWILGPSHHCLGSCRATVYCNAWPFCYDLQSPILFFVFFSIFTSSIDLLLKNKSPYFSISIYKPPNPHNHSSIIISSFLLCYSLPWHFFLSTSSHFISSGRYHDISKKKKKIISRRALWSLLYLVFSPNILIYISKTTH